LQREVSNTDDKRRSYKVFEGLKSNENKHLTVHLLKLGGRFYQYLIFSNRIRFSSRALRATSSDEPDMEMAAISGRRISPNAG